MARRSTRRKSGESRPVETQSKPARQRERHGVNESNLNFAAVVARQAQVSLETTTASAMATPRTASIVEKIEKIRKIAIEDGTPEILELIVREIRTLRREYDQVDARLALMESWIDFDNTQSEIEGKGKMVQNQGQFDRQDVEREQDLLVDPSLRLDHQVNKEELGLED